jgi:hypothetical protein
MGQTLSQTFPLWIQPWISGIYAFHYPDRCLDAAACGGNIPSILTSYIDEVGEATLVLHVLDYTEITGGDIEWSHWAAIRWRGGDRLAVFGRREEGWHLHPMMDVPLSVDELDDLLVAKEITGNNKTEHHSKIMAEALLPHLPFVNMLSIWDGVSPLDCLELEDEDIQDHSSLSLVRSREVIPLIKSSYTRVPWYERENFKSDIGGFPMLLDHNFTTDVLRRTK